MKIYLKYIMRKEVAILIITHYPTLNKYQKISLIQCLKIFGNKYPIYIICPFGMNKDEYISYSNKLIFHEVKASNLESYHAFNHFKINPLLYLKYLKYKFVLFYELDAFVFEDQLEYWISKGYSLIGAPWFEKYYLADENSRIIGQGNGGFSLRNTLQCFIGTFFSYLLRSPKTKKLKIQEDIYLTNHILKYFPGARFPEIEESLRFAIDSNPEKAFKMNKNRIPFGIHAWYKNDRHLGFWKDKLKSFDFEL